MSPETSKDEIKVDKKQEELKKIAKEIVVDTKQKEQLEANLDNWLNDLTVGGIILEAIKDNLWKLKPEKAKEYKALLKALNKDATISDGTENLNRDGRLEKMDQEFDKQETKDKKIMKENKLKEEKNQKSVKEEEKRIQLEAKKAEKETQNSKKELEKASKETKEVANKLLDSKEKELNTEIKNLDKINSDITQAKEEKKDYKDKFTNLEIELHNAITKIQTSTIDEKDEKEEIEKLNNAFEKKITHLAMLINWVEDKINDLEKNKRDTENNVNQLQNEKQALEAVRPENIQEKAQDTTAIETAKIQGMTYDENTNNFNYYWKAISRNQITAENTIENEIKKQKIPLDAKMEELLNGNQKFDVAKNFFEKWDENTYNYIFDQIKAKWEAITAEAKDPMVRNFYQFVEVYAKGTDINAIISNIKIGVEKKNYEQWARLVTLEKESTNTKWEKEKIEKIITRWSQEHMQEMRSKSSEARILIDNTSRDWNFNNFDNKWNYMTFKKYIETHPDYITNNNLQKIINGIKEYKPQEKTADAHETLNDLKNGYANVLTNYITTHPELMPAYITYLRPENVTMLGVDTETQNANLRKITSSEKFKTSEKTNENITNIQSLTEVINGQPKGKLEATMNKGIDAVIKIFGKDFVMGILESFWGKWFLKKFCWRFKLDYEKTFASIDKMYKDKYELTPEQKGILKTNYDMFKGKDKDWENNIKWVDGNNVKFSKTKIEDEYSKTFINKENFKHLDPNLVLNTFNKLKITNNGYVFKNNDQYEINTEKLEKEQGSEIFKNIYTQITKSNNIRDNVQDAGNIVSRTNSIYNTDSKDTLERETATNNRKKQWINDAGDIALYYGAFLMKWSENIAYVRTENPVVWEENRVDEDAKNKADIETKKTTEEAKAKTEKEAKNITDNTDSKYIDSTGLLNKEADKISLDKVITNADITKATIILWDKNILNGSKEKNKPRDIEKKDGKRIFTDTKIKVNIKEWDKVIPIVEEAKKTAETPTTAAKKEVKNS